MGRGFLIISPVMERAQKQIDALVERGDLYEAQQVYKATHRRLVQRKQFAAASEFLQSGIRTMISKNQYLQANELFNLLVELFKMSPENASLDTILQLIDLFPSDADISGPIRGAIKWNQEHRVKTEKIKQAHPALLKAQAMRYWARQEYGESLQAFLEAQAPEELCKMLIEWSEECYPSERDLLFTRAILTLLTHGNMKDANEVFRGVVQRFYAQESSRPPLMNFIQFLLLTLERDAYEFYVKLTEKYAPSLERDAQFEKLLQRIAEVFFKVAPPKNPNDFLGGMLKGLMGGLGGQS